MTTRHGRDAFLTGLGVGAGLMFLFDPQGGGRRRARLRDQVVRSAHKSADAFGATRRDVANRAAGAAARVRGLFHRGDVDDVVLAERVRAQLGRVVSHPRAIEVDVTQGCVTLRGPILQAEVDELVRSVQHVWGVREVVNELDAHLQPGDAPMLQGGGRRPARSAFDVGGWSPTARLVAGTAAAMLTWGLVARAMADRTGRFDEADRSSGADEAEAVARPRAAVEEIPPAPAM